MVSQVAIRLGRESCMTPPYDNSTTFFVLTIVVTYAAALVARRWGSEDSHSGLAGRNLNKWLVGLSAGTTGNSGFIVTAAVALGYTGGLRWLLLPCSWLIGDLVFWMLFPSRINALARTSSAVTLSDMLGAGLKAPDGNLVRIFSAMFLAVFLSVYVAAQWLAGEKFLSGSFGLTTYTALLLFAVSIIGYSSLGGFRGSVFTDTVQAIIRLGGTAIALVVVLREASIDPQLFWENLGRAGPDFLCVFPQGVFHSLAFVGGFAFAAIGFGLGQPQVASRYMAGRSPEETKAAWWIYIGFIQFTWLAMTLFGVALRGVLPHIPDPEAGLSILFRERVGGILTGIIFADVFATIASTSNGILVAITQIVERDLVSRFHISSSGQNISVGLSIVIGGLTIILSLVLPGSVFSLAISAISSIGAGIAGPMMIKLFGWRHTGSSLFVAMLIGISCALVWKWAGFSESFNEAGIGMAVSLGANALLARAETAILPLMAHRK